MKKQAHILYSGRVQGVGFRFTAVSIANDLGVSGWVKNLPDGRVEISAEAEEAILKNYLEQINKTFHSYINNTDISWDNATNSLHDFRVSF